MSVYEIDPLRDPRWIELLERDSRASIFHHPTWLQALGATYGYAPIVLTTSAPGHRMLNGVAFCRVNSWLTGCRMVSLPFSDHCDPLCESYELQEILNFAQTQIQLRNLRYIELRPVTASLSENGASASERFAFHVIDLRPSGPTIFKSFHKNSIRMMIQRAERERLVYEQGSDDQLLKKFYHLFVMTRRRHGVPPSPLRWFRNIVRYLGSRAQVRLASKGHDPVAAIFTLTFGQKMVYKYGASDPRFNKLGATPFLLWKAIEEAKGEGIAQFDLGRSDLGNQGLIRFKDHLGSIRTSLTYWKLPMSAQPTRSSRRFELARRFLLHAPSSIQIGIGSLFAKHMG
jgi:CelD/BcsL family acetyltransferase involved in cellulose biosynthesis